MWTKKDFTILELLVVVAIIFVLAAILLPALGSARNSVQRISCANNLRNINQGAMMYSSDGDSFLPPAVQAGFISYYTSAYFRQGGGERKYWNSALSLSSLAFAKAVGTYFCPMMDKASRSPLWTKSTEPSLYYSSYNATTQRSSYANDKGGCWVWNPSDGSNPALLTRKIEKIYGNGVLACDRAFLESDTGSAYGWWAGADSLTSGWQYSSTSNPWTHPAFIHQGNLSNFMFKDGHVQSYKYTGAQLFDKDYLPLK